MNEKQLKPKLMPLPCPFCGTEPSLAPQNPDKEGGAWGMVYCDNKECGVKPKVNDGIREADERGTGAYIDLAILRWNKRGI